MTKTTLALAAALIAGTTMMTSAANAGGLRLGFGFPLGTFVAHSNQNYSEGGDSRRYHERERMERRYDADQAAAAAAARRARAAKVETAEVTKPVAPVTKVAKLDDKLASDPATTTEIAKTSTETSTDKTTDTTTTATTTDTTDTDTAKVATAETTTTNAKTDVTTGSLPDTKRVCRRFSPAIAALVDVPCE